MATKKSGGTTHLGRDSKPKYLGIKAGGGEKISAGNVLVRQRGTRYHAGKNVRKGKDDTLYAVISGIVKFQSKKRKRFDGSLKKSVFVNIEPLA